VIKTDFRAAEIDEPTKTMLEYCVALTVQPSAMNESWIGRLREQGFGDDAIHDITQVAAYFNYINRIADGLGVEPEDFMKPTSDARSRDEGSFGKL